MTAPTTPPTTVPICWPEMVLLLKQSPARLHESNRGLGALLPVAAAQKELHVGVRVLASECKRHYVVQLVDLPELCATAGTSTLLKDQQFLDDIGREASAIGARPCAPVVLVNAMPICVQFLPPSLRFSPPLRIRILPRLSHCQALFIVFGPVLRRPPRILAGVPFLDLFSIRVSVFGSLGENRLPVPLIPLTTHRQPFFACLAQGRQPSHRHACHGASRRCSTTCFTPA